MPPRSMHVSLSVLLNQLDKMKMASVLYKVKIMPFDYLLARWDIDEV